jgi:hypothetical protein
MSTLTYVTQKRSTTVVKDNIYVQIDSNESMRLKNEIGGAQPSFSHWIYTQDGPLDAKTGDLLVDQNPDISGEINAYRVAGKPEHFDWHSEIPCDLKAGT